MAAYDISLTPVAVTPANTSDTTLDPDNTGDAFVYVDATNIGASTYLVRLGITPNGGSVHWKVFGFPLPPGEALDRGPWFLQAGDVVTVGTSSANNVTFSLTGTEST